MTNALRAIEDGANSTRLRRASLPLIFAPPDFYTTVRCLGRFHSCDPGTLSGGATTLYFTASTITLSYFVSATGACVSERDILPQTPQGAVLVQDDSPPCPLARGPSPGPRLVGYFTLAALPMSVAVTIPASTYLLPVAFLLPASTYLPLKINKNYLIFFCIYGIIKISL